MRGAPLRFQLDRTSRFWWPHSSSRSSTRCFCALEDARVAHLRARRGLVPRLREEEPHLRRVAHGARAVGPHPLPRRVARGAVPAARARRGHPPVDPLPPDLLPRLRLRRRLLHHHERRLRPPGQRLPRGAALRRRAMPPPPPPSRPPRARARAPSSTSTITRPPSLPPWDGRFPQRARITRPAKGGPVARTMALALGITAAAHTLAPTPAPPAHRRAASSAPRTSTAASTCGSRSTGRAPSSAASR